jgi:hypothetical protein
MGRPVKQHVLALTNRRSSTQRSGPSITFIWAQACRQAAQLESKAHTTTKITRWWKAGGDDSVELSISRAVRFFSSATWSELAPGRLLSPVPCIWIFRCWPAWYRLDGDVRGAASPARNGGGRSFASWHSKTNRCNLCWLRQRITDTSSKKKRITDTWCSVKLGHERVSYYFEASSLALPSIVRL